MEKKAVYNRRLYIYLIVGLVLWIVGLIGTYCFPPEDVISEEGQVRGMNGMLDHILYNKGWFIFILSTAIVYPIREEIVFRLWVKNNKWAKIISFLFMFGFSLFIDLPLFYRIVFCVLVICLPFVTFVKRLEKLYIPVLIIVTSILFSVVHITNFAISESTSLYLLSIFGFGMVLAFLGLRFGLRYSILLHTTNNMFVSILILLPMFTFQDIEGKNGDFSYQIQKVPMFGMQESSDSTVMHFKGSPEDILVQLSSPVGDTVFLAEKETNLNIIYKVKSEDASFNPKRIKSSLLQKLRIEKESGKMKGYLLCRNDDFTVKSDVPISMYKSYVNRRKFREGEPERYIFQKPKEFISYLKDRFGLSVVLDIDNDFEVGLYVPSEFYLIKDRAEVLDYISNHPELCFKLHNKELNYVKYTYSG